MLDVPDYAMKEYLFEDYVLRSDGILMCKGIEIHIPPKELDVFILLLNEAGRLVTKEKIFSYVWQKHAASDESLTRCVYVLRQLLGENKKCRYIETVYGKGYRFRPSVTVRSYGGTNRQKATIAIFPFRTETPTDEILLHNGIIQSLSSQAILQFDVLPAVVTQDCRDFESISTFITKLRPKYYLTGKMINEKESKKVFIEIVQASSHKLLYNHALDLNIQTGVTGVIPDIIAVMLSKIQGPVIENTFQHAEPLYA